MLLQPAIDEIKFFQSLRKRKTVCEIKEKKRILLCFSSLIAPFAKQREQNSVSPASETLDSLKIKRFEEGANEVSKISLRKDAEQTPLAFSLFKKKSITQKQGRDRGYALSTLNISNVQISYRAFKKIFFDLEHLKIEKLLTQSKNQSSFLFFLYKKMLKKHFYANSEKIWFHLSKVVTQFFSLTQNYHNYDKKEDYFNLTAIIWSILDFFVFKTQIILFYNKLYYFRSTNLFFQKILVNSWCIHIFYYYLLFIFFLPTQKIYCSAVKMREQKKYFTVQQMFLEPEFYQDKGSRLVFDQDQYLTLNVLQKQNKSFRTRNYESRKTDTILLFFKLKQFLKKLLFQQILTPQIETKIIIANYRPREGHSIYDCIEYLYNSFKKGSQFIFKTIIGINSLQLFQKKINDFFLEYIQSFTHCFYYNCLKQHLFFSNFIILQKNYYNFFFKKKREAQTPQFFPILLSFPFRGVLPTIKDCGQRWREGEKAGAGGTKDCGQRWREKVRKKNAEGIKEEAWGENQQNKKYDSVSPFSKKNETWHTQLQTKLFWNMEKTTFKKYFRYIFKFFRETKFIKNTITANLLATKIIQYHDSTLFIIKNPNFVLKYFWIFQNWFENQGLTFAEKNLLHSYFTLMPNSIESRSIVNSLYLTSAIKVRKGHNSKPGFDFAGFYFVQSKKKQKGPPDSLTFQSKKDHFTIKDCDLSPIFSGSPSLSTIFDWGGGRRHNLRLWRGRSLLLRSPHNQRLCSAKPEKMERKRLCRRSLLLCSPHNQRLWTKMERRREGERRRKQREKKTKNKYAEKNLAK